MWKKYLATKKCSFMKYAVLIVGHVTTCIRLESRLYTACFTQLLS